MKTPSVLLSCFLFVQHGHGFMPLSHRSAPSRSFGFRATTAPSDAATSSVTTLSDDIMALPDGDASQAIRAPLRFIGPYPALALRFPRLATEPQRARNVTGVSLDFVLDTAANTNTIQQQVAQELQLPIVGSALPGVTAGGSIQGGETFLLGDAQLDGLGPAGNFTFMTELTASALPVASPAAAGLLSLAFLYTFDGVGFHWTATDDKPPSVTFYGKVPQSALQHMNRVAIRPVPMTQLPSVVLRVNGCDIPALLDTGSPVTVFNAQAAKQAGIQTVAFDVSASKNPLTNMANRVQQAQAMARGDVLQVMGERGPVNLLKSATAVGVSLPSTTTASVDFAPCSVYVGDLPGLAALQGIAGVDESSPAVVLGMDVLRQRPEMLLRARHNEVWF